jgi:hypothetical protein
MRLCEREEMLELEGCATEGDVLGRPDTLERVLSFLRSGMNEGGCMDVDRGRPKLLSVVDDESRAVLDPSDDLFE